MKQGCKTVLGAVGVRLKLRFGCSRVGDPGLLYQMGELHSHLGPSRSFWGRQHQMLIYEVLCKLSLSKSVIRCPTGLCGCNSPSSRSRREQTVWVMAGDSMPWLVIWGRGYLLWVLRAPFSAGPAVSSCLVGKVEPGGLFSPLLGVPCCG